MFARESECAKAAILRSPRKFHGSRYHAAAHFVTEKSGVSRKFRPMELLPVHAIHPRFTSSSIIPDIPDEPIRSLEATGASGKAFSAWADAEGLLLVPPENGVHP